MKTLAACRSSAILPSVLFWEVYPRSWFPSHVLCIQVRSFHIVLISSPDSYSLALIVRTLYKSYSKFNELFASDNSLNRTRYLRVLVIALLGSVCLIPLGLYSLIRGSIGVYPWPGWNEIHANISQIQPVPASIWRSDHVGQYNLEIVRWEFVFNAFVLFAVFGIHKEARASYLSATRGVLRRIPCFRVNKYFISLNFSYVVLS
jgi:hypothetical protein